MLLTVTGTGQRLVERIRGDLVEEKKALLAEFPEEVRESAAELIQRLTTRQPHPHRLRGADEAPGLSP